MNRLVNRMKVWTELVFMAALCAAVCLGILWSGAVFIQTVFGERAPGASDAAWSHALAAGAACWIGMAFLCHVLDRFRRFGTGQRRSGEDRKA